MAIKDIIKVLSKPSIALKEVALPDDSKLNDGNSSFITGKSGKSTKDSAGRMRV